MKRFYILLLICSFAVAVRPQELRLSTALPPDTAALLIDYRYYPYQVQRELRLLVDEPDEWRTELHCDEIQSDAWRRDHGRQYTWRIGVDATTFLRDAAFSLPYTRGYTATGFFVKPYAKHLIGQDAQMTFGLLLSGVAGYDGLRAWQPLVRLTSALSWVRSMGRSPTASTSRCSTASDTSTTIRRRACKSSPTIR